MNEVRVINNAEFEAIIKEIKDGIECPPEDLSYNIIDYNKVFGDLEPITHINTVTGVGKMVNALEEISKYDFESITEKSDTINENTALGYARSLYWYECLLMNLQYIMRDINFSDTASKLRKMVHLNKINLDNVIDQVSKVTTDISTDCDMLIATFEKRNYDDSRTSYYIDHLKKTIINTNNTAANLIMEIKLIKEWRVKYESV